MKEKSFKISSRSYNATVVFFFTSFYCILYAYMYIQKYTRVAWHSYPCISMLIKCKFHFFFFLIQTVIFSNNIVSYLFGYQTKKKPLYTHRFLCYGEQICISEKNGWGRWITLYSNYKNIFLLFTKEHICFHFFKFISYLSNQWSVDLVVTSKSSSIIILLK